MTVGFDWSMVEKVGGLGLCVVLIYFGFQAFKIVLEQWKNSTDAVNKNTEAFVELSKVFERSHEREIEFHDYTKTKLEASEKREKLILKTVVEINEKTL